MTFIDQIEQIKPLLVSWAVDTVDTVVNAIAPDGRPFGYVPGTPEQLITEYMQYRDNPEAWTQKLLEDTANIQEKLAQAGIPSDEIQGVHPWDIAVKININYSYHMEELIAKHGEP